MSKTKTKPAKNTQPKAGRPRTRPAADTLYTMIRHSSAEKDAWDEAAQRTGQQLGIPVSRSAWLRSLANKAAGAISAAPFNAPPQATGFVAPAVEHGNDQPKPPRFGDARSEQPVLTVNKPPRRNPDGSLADAPATVAADRLPRQPSAQALATLKVISTEGGSDDAQAVKELRSLGLIDSNDVPTDRGMEYVMS